jgi:hypothetical protein
MIIYKLLVVWALSTGCACATTLAPDSLLCESDAELQFAKQTPWLAGLGGSKTIEQAKISAKLPELKRQYAAIAQTRAAKADAEAAEAQSQPMQRLATTCAASGTAPLAAQVLEVKAISGVTKVKVEFRGTSVPLWTASSSLSE